MLACLLVTQLGQDVITSEEDCEGTFCEEGLFPGQYLDIIMY